MKYLYQFYFKVRDTIRLKFIVTFLIFLILPFTFLTQIFTYQIKELLMSKERTYVSDKLHIMSEQISEMFQDMSSIAVSLVLNNSVTTILKTDSKAPSYDWFTEHKKMQNILSILASYRKYQYHITVIDSHNQSYKIGASYNNNLKIDSKLVQDICGISSLEIINRELSGYDENPVITLGKAIYEKETFLGVILIEVETSEIERLVSSYGQNDTLLYILQNEKVIFTTNQKMITDSIELTDIIRQQKELITMGNEDYMVNYNQDKNTGIDLVMLTPKSAVYKESSQIMNNFIRSFIVIVALTVWAIFKLTSLLVHRIKCLNEEVERFGQDINKSIDLPIQETDEVGQLTEGVMQMSKQIKQLLNQVKEIERNKRILEFKALQAQINPHMIYNTLNTITYLAQLQNVTNIQEISYSFAHLLRTISKGKSEFLTIQEEVQYIKDYIAIKKYNLLCDIDVAYDVEEELLDQKILKLILQPIIENAIIHGFVNCITEAFLVIHIYKNENKVAIDIVDNGVGMEEHVLIALLEGKEEVHNTLLSVGIYNVKERLKLQYDDRAIFNIISYPGKGTTVHIEYPIIDKGDKEEL